jgi:hypothetical protein
MTPCRLGCGFAASADGTKRQFCGIIDVILSVQSAPVGKFTQESLKMRIAGAEIDILL